MTFFETMLALLFAAIILLQVARRLSLPYPALLALAGVVVAFIPGSPAIRIDPATALALFIAPVLLDAAYDFPVRAAWKLWRPLVVLAVVAVLATTAAVAAFGWAYVGLPLPAAIVLGAIVAPPDAAAATAVLGTVSLPKRTIAVLKGESLFNDATALLLFSGGLAVQANGGFDTAVGLQLAIAAPGGLVFGIAAGFAMRAMNRFVAGTLGGSILQFINAFGVWILAEHLHLSAVLAVVGCAMTVARVDQAAAAPRIRVHSFAVWATVVFLLNVLAFLLMGLQARIIIGRMTPAQLHEALRVAALVVAIVIAVRMAVVLLWNALATRYAAVRGDLSKPTFTQGLFVGWSGMRGLVTLATAFALPAAFPQREVVVLCAFSVVLATLVVQGLTLTPLIRWLKLDRMEDDEAEMAAARTTLAEAALSALADAPPPAADNLRYIYELRRDDGEPARAYKAAGMLGVAAERQALEAMRAQYRLSDDAYYRLQEEIDWRELTLLPEDKRRIEEG